MSIDEKVRAAKALGISYGQYVAMLYETRGPVAPPPKKKTNRRPRSFTDAEAFALWQSLMTDAEIGHALGVSRAYIQRWRDQLELPSTSKIRTDTKKYRLAALQDGTTIVVREDDQL